MAGADQADNARMSFGGEEARVSIEATADESARVSLMTALDS